MTTEGRGCPGVARASGTEKPRIGQEGVPASKRVEEKHGSVAVYRGRGIGAPEVAAAHRIRGGRELDFVAIPEADPAVVKIRHVRLAHNLVTDLVGAKLLLIFAHA
jgi:hypothetical protein